MPDLETRGDVPDLEKVLGGGVPDLETGVLDLESGGGVLGLEPELFSNRTNCERTSALLLSNSSLDNIYNASDALASSAGSCPSLSV